MKKYHLENISGTICLVPNEKPKEDYRMEQKILNILLFPIKILVYILFLIIEILLADDDDFPVINKDQETKERP